MTLRDIIHDSLSKKGLSDDDIAKHIDSLPDKYCLLLDADLPVDYASNLSNLVDKKFSKLFK